MGEKIKNSPAPDIHQGIVHPAEIIYQQLQRIFASSQFDGTKTQRAFLKYVVRKTIEENPIRSRGTR
jgi:hypothetical protein